MAKLKLVPYRGCDNFSADSVRQQGKLRYTLVSDLGLDCGPELKLHGNNKRPLLRLAKLLSGKSYVSVCDWSTEDDSPLIFCNY